MDIESITSFNEPLNVSIQPTNDVCFLTNTSVMEHIDVQNMNKPEYACQYATEIFNYLRNSEVLLLFKPNIPF